MALDATRKNSVIGNHAVCDATAMMSGSISEYRITVPMQPNVLDWLKVEARVFGLTVPALIRHKLQTMFENRPPDWRDKLKG
jgi:hypothetical protein